VPALLSVSAWPCEQSSHAFVAILANCPASHGTQLVYAGWLT
jgi:hypothetical protein